MGCDIHGWIEVKVNNKWIAKHALPDCGRDRYYARFTRLASVRGAGPRKPLGVPVDVSDTAQLDINDWGVDGHSHSYLSLREAAQDFLETDWNPSDYAKKYPLSHYFNLDREEEYQDVRLVFWFDN